MTRVSREIKDEVIRARVSSKLKDRYYDALNRKGYSPSAHMESMMFDFVEKVEEEGRKLIFVERTFEWAGRHIDRCLQADRFLDEEVQDYMVMQGLTLDDVKQMYCDAINREAEDDRYMAFPGWFRDVGYAYGRKAAT